MRKRIQDGPFSITLTLTLTLTLTQTLTLTLTLTLQDGPFSIAVDASSIFQVKTGPNHDPTPTPSQPSTQP